MPLTDDQALDQYIQAAHAQAKAVVCGFRMSWFIAEFERKFDAWRAAHAEEMERGARLAEARGLGGDKPGSISASARDAALELNNASKESARTQCDELMLVYTPREK